MGRHVFNRLYESILQNPEFYFPPNKEVDDDVLRVFAWNSAFMAASLTSRGEKHLIDRLIKEIKGWEPKELRPR